MEFHPEHTGFSMEKIPQKPIVWVDVIMSFRLVDHGVMTSTQTSFMHYCYFREIFIKSPYICIKFDPNQNG